MKTGSKQGDDCRFRVIPRSQDALPAASIPAAPALLEPWRYKHGSSHWRYPAVAHSDPSLSAGGGAECGGEGGAFWIKMWLSGWRGTVENGNDRCLCVGLRFLWDHGQ